MLGVVVLILTIVMSFGYVLDFLCGDKVTTKVRASVYEYYFTLSEDWRSVYRIPALLIENLLSSMFKTNAGVLQTVKWITIYSIIVTLMMSLLVCYLKITFDNREFKLVPYIVYSMKFFMISVPGNIIGDLFVWPISIILLAQIRRANFLTATLLAIVMLVLSYVVAATILTIGFVSFGISQMLQDGYQVLFDSEFYKAILDAISLGEPMYLSGLMYVPFLPDPAPLSVIQLVEISIPAILFIIILMASIIIYPMRSRLQEPTLFLLERIESYPKNFLVLLAGALSAIIAILTAWMKASP